MKFAILAMAVALLSGRLLASHAQEPIRRGSLQLPPDVRERCLATLQKGIKSDEFWPAMHAAEALTLAGAPDEVIATFRDRLPRETNDQRRCGLAQNSFGPVIAVACQFCSRFWSIGSRPDACTRQKVSASSRSLGMARRCVLPLNPARIRNCG